MSFTDLAGYRAAFAEVSEWAAAPTFPAPQSVEEGNELVEGSEWDLIDVGIFSHFLFSPLSL